MRIKARKDTGTNLTTEEDLKPIIQLTNGLSLYDQYLEKVCDANQKNTLSKQEKDNQKMILMQNIKARRDRIGSHSPSAKDQLKAEQGDKDGTKTCPIYIILKGKADVVLTNSRKEQTVVETLRSGDAFGYSELLRVYVSL